MLQSKLHSVESWSQILQNLAYSRQPIPRDRKLYIYSLSWRHHQGAESLQTGRKASHHLKLFGGSREGEKACLIISRLIGSIQPPAGRNMIEHLGGSIVIAGHIADQRNQKDDGKVFSALKWESSSWSEAEPLLLELCPMFTATQQPFDPSLQQPFTA